MEGLEKEVLPTLDNQALSIVGSVYYALDPVQAATDEVGEIDSPQITDLIALRGFMEKVIKAGYAAKKQLDLKIAQELGPNGEIRYGNSFYRNRPTKTFKVTEAALCCEWLGDDLKRAINVPNAVRVTSLRQIAEEREQSPQAVLDTFGRWTVTEGALTVLPIDKAPKYAQHLEDGQRSFPKGKQLAEAD